MANWWTLSNNNNWDLHAVVRGCSSSATIDHPFSSYPPILSKEEYCVYGDEVISFPELTSIHEPEELRKPFFSKPDNPAPEQSSPSATQETRQQEQPRRPTSRKRRNQQKKVVCQVPADGVSADMWAWRKYGQKPIKGSPFPRGYYRCSSSKGCMARKQVERSQADPSMLVITYTAEHDHPIPTHRNSLAGSTRNKFGMSMMSTRAQVPSPRTHLMASVEEELMGEDEMGQSADLEESSHKSSNVAGVDSDDDDEFVKSFFSSR